MAWPRGVADHSAPIAATGAGVSVSAPLLTPAMATPAPINWVVDRGPGHHKEGVDGSDGARSLTYVLIPGAQSARSQSERSCRLQC